MKTNFSKLTTEQKTVWSRDVWKQARENSFIMQMASKGANSPIQRITELTKSERGDRAVITLVTDLEGDGVVGDADLEGNEDELKAYDEVIAIDQLRNAVRNTGRMADQKTVVNFRENAKDTLAFWLADRMDQMAVLTLSGITYGVKTNGAARPASSKLTDLAFAADVSAPTTARHLRIKGNDVDTGNTASLTPTDKLKYNHIIDIHTFAREQFIRPIRTAAGVDIYHMYVSPQVMAQLKKDPDFRENIRHAWTRGSSNPLFKGGESYMLDGVVVHSLRHSYTNRGAANGAKWGAAGDVNGNRMLFLGAQALGVADLGPGYWDEKSDFDYNNQKGIAYGKIFGLLKPKFHSQVTGNVQDFGCIAVDVAI
jgi:N4-gp56 family major capsid protein